MQCKEANLNESVFCVHVCVIYLVGFIFDLCNYYNFDFICLCDALLIN